MPEEDQNPLFSPPLRRHRLIRVGDAVPSAIPDAASVGQEGTIGGSFPNATPPERLLAAQSKLAEDAARLVGEVLPALDALQTVFAARGATEKIQETLGLVCSALRVLPGELASGAAASVARVDWIFARLLNAPGEPGLIGLTLEALTEPAEEQTPAVEAPEPLIDDAAAPEVLRRLHRDLVSLQQGWEDMLELTLPPELFEPLPLPTPAPLDEAPASPEEAPAAPPMTPAPLPEGLVVAHPASGGRVSGGVLVARRRSGALANMQPALAMALIVLVLALTGAGVYAIQNLRGQPVDSNNAAVIARLPSPTATATTQPTAAPTATATATATATSTPTPRPTATNTPTPTVTPSPTPTSLCAPGSTLCASVSALQVACSGQPGVSFQLSNGGKTSITWVALSSSIDEVTLVSTDPMEGTLKPGHQVTVTVTARARGQKLKGTLTILYGFQNNQSLAIALQVC